MQILLIALFSAVCTNFIRVFESSQIADISFYMMYLLIGTLLIGAFAEMQALTVNTLKSLFQFVTLLLPAYVVTIVFSAGSVSALGFYELTLLSGAYSSAAFHKNGTATDPDLRRISVF